ncbi:restriction endonuclease subunit S [Virgibacillus sp. DJP39]|uniref:restriction endonuclease subunit S n=1 Tax=Virgibacillus sp. DJP39 TaxID=3409790 RepID=UPI003BB6C2F4
MYQEIKDRIKAISRREVPEGYKTSDLGIIPDDWNIKKLSDLSVVITKGTTPTSYGFEYQSKGINFVKTENILENGDVDIDSTPKISIECDEVLSRSRLNEDDVLVSIAGSIGKTSIIKAEYLPANTNQALAIIRLEQQINPLYIKYLLSSSLFTRYFNSIKTVGAQPNLSLKQVGEFQIPIFKNDEINEICRLLSTWDKAIELKEKLIDQKKEQKKGLMQRLLWGHVRWDDGDNFTIEQLQDRHNQINSGITPRGFQEVKRFIIPQDWQFIKMDKIGQQITSKNKEHKILKVLSCTKHGGLVDSLEYFGKQVFGSDLSKYKVVAKGDFAYATNHIEEGSIGLQKEYDYGLVSPMYTVFRANKDIDNEFLYALLKTENYRRIYKSMMSASVDRRGSLRWKEFSTIEIPIPPLKEQKKISAILLTADKEVKTLEKELTELKQQKVGIMQLLLTGKIRVKV